MAELELNLRNKSFSTFRSAKSTVEPNSKNKNDQKGKNKKQRLRSGLSNRSTKIKNEIQDYLEIIDTLEHEHRSDLFLHLYSMFLLKKMIRRANEKKFPLETESFIDRHLNDDMVKWPDRLSVIDPTVDKLYEDDPPKVMENKRLDEIVRIRRLIHNSTEVDPIDIRNNIPIDISTEEQLTPGEVSERALRHATNMMNIELNALWGQKLKQSAQKANINFDINEMTIPLEICSNILQKLDHIMKGLHLKRAERNDIDLENIEVEEEEGEEEKNQQEEIEENNDNVSDENMDESLLDDENVLGSVASECIEDLDSQEKISTPNTSTNSALPNEISPQETDINQIIDPDITLPDSSPKPKNLKYKTVEERKSAYRESVRRGLQKFFAKQKEQRKKDQELVKYVYHLDKTDPNKNIQFTYHEILDRCFEMDLDMKNIYMKSLKLFNDIPGTYSKIEFKIKKDTLKRYKVKYKKGRKIFTGLYAKQFYDVDTLLEDQRIPKKRKKLMEIITRKDAEKAAEWKTFLQVQENQRKLYGGELPTYPSDITINDEKDMTAKRNSNIIKSVMPYIDNCNETGDDSYNIIDCLIPVPTCDHKVKRLYQYTQDDFK